MFTLIQNGYLVDPANSKEGNFDLLMKGEFIEQVAEEISMDDIISSHHVNEEDIIIIDAKGQLVMPGFIDLHVHLREPGFEYKETIATGTQSAAAGGFTSICPMPNTSPAMDSPEHVNAFLEKVKKDAIVNILTVGAVTCGQEGNILSDIKGMVEAGIYAVSEDGKSVMDTSIYAEGMRIAGELDIPVLAHCEDKNLVGNGVVNKGLKSEELNLPGISNAVEDIIVARDIILAKENNARLHLCHCSTGGSSEMIQFAKKLGIDVTGEICPHHFTLSEEDIKEDDANYKMNPPLRSKKDVEILKEAIRDGIIDVIATDHAPHSAEEKSKSMLESPFGIVGFETAFPLTISELVNEGYISLSRMVEMMSVNPAKIIGIDRGNLAVGKVADIVIADKDEEYEIDKNTFHSKSNNTPFHGRRVKGRIKYTIVGGKIVYQY